MTSSSLYSLIKILQYFWKAISVWSRVIQSVSNYIFLKFQKKKECFSRKTTFFFFWHYISRNNYFLLKNWQNLNLINYTLLISQNLFKICHYHWVNGPINLYDKSFSMIVPQATTKSYDSIFVKLKQPRIQNLDISNTTNKHFLTT